MKTLLIRKYACYIYTPFLFLQKVKSECRVNCSCEIDYIWEQDKVIHSKTAVNCSNRGFHDFPDPADLPRPTDTLYLNTNQVTTQKTKARTTSEKDRMLGFLPKWGSLSPKNDPHYFPHFLGKEINGEGSCRELVHSLTNFSHLSPRYSKWETRIQN